MICKLPRNSVNYILIACFLSLIFTGCTTTSQPENNYAYFGGEIVNPNNDYVVLFKEGGIKDTIYLDQNNMFLHKIDNIENGIYYFSHQPENQMALIEKGDSLLIRLNTLEFDESLVFSGKGAKKNNFLIDMFLQNEIERKSIERNKFYFSFPTFRKYQDSLLNLRNQLFKRFTKKNKSSDFAKKVLKSSYTYDFYTRYEMFMRWQHTRSSIDSLATIPKDYFKYRKEISFNDNDLKRLFAYNRFLYHFVNNLAYNQVSPETYTLNGATLTIKELEIIDSLIDHEYIKNSLLRGFTGRYLISSKTNKGSNDVLKLFLEKNTNRTYQEELKNLALITSRLKPNKVLPDHDLINASGETVLLSSLFNKPITALYFWSTKNKTHFIKAHQKADQLRAQFPEYNFIGVNTDTDQTKNWLHTIKRYGFEPTNEYELKYAKCSSKELIINSPNKVILVNNEGKIIDANANLFSIEFEKQLMTQ